MTPRLLAFLLLATGTGVLVPIARGQVPRDSLAASDSASGAPATPVWRSGVRYGGGPSVGAPPSDFTGKAPPAHWCLGTDGPGGGDISARGTRFKDVSRSWLRRVLSDTTDWGATWRKVLGDAPLMIPSDSIVEITDEHTCEVAAQVINRELLGWSVGPPPVVVFRVKNYLVVYPSNARMGEFGFAVGMSADMSIRGVATW